MKKHSSKLSESQNWPVNTFTIGSPCTLSVCILLRFCIMPSPAWTLSVSVQVLRRVLPHSVEGHDQELQEDAAVCMECRGCTVFAAAGRGPRNLDRDLPEWVSSPWSCSCSRGGHAGRDPDSSIEWDPMRENVAYRFVYENDIWVDERLPSARKSKDM